MKARGKYGDSAERKNIKEQEEFSNKSFDSHSDSDEFDPNVGEEGFGDVIDEAFGLIKGYDLMVVLDRSNDLVTPFVSQTSYMGMVDDLLKGESLMNICIIIRNNRVIKELFC